MTDSKQRIIRRYQNRKLYDTHDSKYVTLEDIAVMIKEGQDVKVVDNKSKRDLTSLTLTQIIFEEEKKEKSILPLSVLQDIIKAGSDSVQEIVDRFIAPGINSVQQAKIEVEKAIDRLVNRGKLRDEDRRHILKDLYEHSQKSMEDIARQVEDNVARVFDSFRTITALSAKVKKLEEDVEALEKALAEKRTRSE